MNRPGPKELANHLLPAVRLQGETTCWSMNQRLSHYRCPGVGVAVIDRGELVWAEGYGVIEDSKPASVRSDTMFSGASISKPVTAVLALQFVDRGFVDLDTDVNRYLTSWRVPDNAFTRQHPVTLRLLLSHRAGTTIHGFGAYSWDLPHPTALDILTQRLIFTEGGTTNGVTVDKVPGQSTRYSGGGTTIVEQLLEDISGKRFHELAQENIFGPLHMTRSTFEAPLPERYFANTAVGHNDKGPLPEKFTYVPATSAGGIYTTPADYARFMIACRDAYLEKPNAILSPGIANEMMTARGGEFGLGWEIIGNGAGRRFGHGGSNAGYQCESTCYLESGQGAVVMTNAESGLFFYWEVFNGIADLFGWPDFMLPPKKIRPIPVEDFPRYVGEYAIVSGVDAPEMKIWIEDGKLKSQITGMRGGAREIFMDQNGRFFNRLGPYETEVIYDENAIARELVVLREGKTEIMRARRRTPTT